MQKLSTLALLLISSSALCSSQKEQNLPNAEQFKELIVNAKSTEQQLDSLTKKTEKNKAKAILATAESTLYEAYLNSNNTDIRTKYNNIIEQQKYKKQMNQLIIKRTEKVLEKGDKIELPTEKYNALQSAAEAFNNNHPLEHRKPNQACAACELL